MDKLSFSRMRKRLLLGGVAPRYVERTIRELRSHLDDLKQQELEHGASEVAASERATDLLGEEDRIVEEVLAKPEIRSWPYRFRKSIFLAGPLFIYVVAALGITLAYTVPVISMTDLDISNPWPAWYFWLAKLASLFSEYLLTPLIAMAFCVLAIKRSVPMLWPMIGIGVVVFFGSGWETVIEMPVDARRGNISFQWGYEFIPWRYVQSGWIQTIEQLVRICVTMGLVYLLSRYYRPYETEAG